MRVNEMTVICRKYRFIHIHNQKTGGSSMEVVLSKFCGENDVVTPESDLLRKDLGYQTAVNYLSDQYEWKIRRDTLRRLWANIRELLRRASRNTVFGGTAPLDYYYPIFLHQKYVFGRHSSAQHIKAQLPEDVWDNYHKYTIIREPVSQFASFYKYRRGKPLAHDTNQAASVNKIQGFSKFIDLCAETFFLFVNHQIFDGVNAGEVHYIKYENLSDELTKVSKLLQLPEDLSKLMDETRIRPGDDFTFSISKEDKDRIYSLAGNLRKYYTRADLD